MYVLTTSKWYLIGMYTSHEPSVIYTVKLQDNTGDYLPFVLYCHLDHIYSFMNLCFLFVIFNVIANILFTRLSIFQKIT